MKEAYFKYILPKKKLERRTKQKQKLNAQIKEKHYYWERSNMKITTTETWMKPIIHCQLRSYNLQKSTSSASGLETN